MVQHSWTKRSSSTFRCSKCGCIRMDCFSRFQHVHFTMYEWVNHVSREVERSSRRPECAEIFAAVDPRISAYIRRELNG